MHVATGRFPRVWVSAAPPSNWESGLDALLRRGERFVLLTRDLPRNDRVAGAERKRFALWFKRNRQRLAEVGAGGIVIVPNEAVALALRPMTAPLRKAFGYPVRIATADRLESEIVALLDGA